MSENEEPEDFVIDLNTASEEELGRLPGIGPVLATRIVDYREEVGPFQEPVDVISVPGVTQNIYDRFAGQLTAGQPGGSEVDLNSASEKELSRLPGIGPVLATRIMAYREEVGPFQEPADVVAVPGIAQSLYDRFAGQLTVGQVESVPPTEPEEPEEEETLVVPDLDEPDMDIDLEAELEAEPEPEPESTEWDEPAEMPESAVAFGDLDEDVSAEQLVEETAEADEAPEPVSEPPPFVVVPREDRGGCWRLLAVGLLSALAGAAMSLVLLFMINGTLNYQVATRQVLKAEVVRLDGEIGMLNDGLVGLQSRMESVEGLAAELDGAQADIRRLAEDLTILHGSLERLAGELDDTQAALGALAGDVEEIEANVGALTGDVEEIEANVVALQTQFSTVEDQLNTLSGELDAVLQTAERFDGFLEGLRNLLGQSAKPTPEDSPFNFESPPPTLVPPTRQPVFTVIPLATPTPPP